MNQQEQNTASTIRLKHLLFILIIWLIIFFNGIFGAIFLHQTFDDQCMLDGCAHNNYIKELKIRRQEVVEMLEGIEE